MDLRQLIAAGAQERGRSSLQELQIQLVLDIVSHIHVLLINEALDTVAHAVHLTVATLHCSLENTCKACVDDRSRAAGLSYNNITLHNYYPFLNRI